MLSHVLVIEDQYLFAEYLTDVLRVAGAFSMAVVGTEEEAVASAEDRAPSLILSDIDLPDGTGPSAVTKIVGAHGTVPVIYVAGRRSPFLPHATACLSKPVSPAEILLAISDAWLERRASR